MLIVEMTLKHYYKNKLSQWEGNCFDITKVCKLIKTDWTSWRDKFDKVVPIKTFFLCALVI